MLGGRTSWWFVPRKHWPVVEEDGDDCKTDTRRYFNGIHDSAGAAGSTSASTAHLLNDVRAVLLLAWSARLVRVLVGWSIHPSVGLCAL